MGHQIFIITNTRKDLEHILVFNADNLSGYSVGEKCYKFLKYIENYVYKIDNEYMDIDMIINIFLSNYQIDNNNYTYTNVYLYSDDINTLENKGGYTMIDMRDLKNIFYCFFTRHKNLVDIKASKVKYEENIPYDIGKWCDIYYPVNLTWNLCRKDEKFRSVFIEKCSDITIDYYALYYVKVITQRHFDRIVHKLNL